MLLLLPVVWLLVPVPIDETRYLAVAWEMRQTGEYLVPHLNGATYAHKPPMLFWLINLGWMVTGVHAWTARAMVLLCSVASVLLLRNLVLRLGGSPNTARNAMWLLLGSAYFAVFANAIMFDVLLTTCVLLGVHGLLDLAREHVARGVLLTACGLGLGILVKGPVIALFIAVLAFTAPWWSTDLVRGTRARYFARFALAFVAGAAIGLAWAIPAAIHGGEEYARSIFLSQTIDRLEGARGKSTHARPWWWYGVVFPLMLLPWPLVIRAQLRSLRGLLQEQAVRLALAWVLPTVVVFSLIGGKQPHYLLPVIPGVALGLATGLDRGVLRVRGGVLAAALVVFGVALAAVPYYAGQQQRLAYLGDTTPAWGCAVAGLGILLLLLRRQAHAPWLPALAMMLAVLLLKLAVIEGPGQRYELETIGKRIADGQERGQPMIHFGWHHGVYEFAGRLTQPLPAVRTYAQLTDWARHHPDGWVIGFSRDLRFHAKPLFTQTFRGGEMSIWSAHAVLDSDMGSEVEHSRDPVDEDAED